MDKNEFKFPDEKTPAAEDKFDFELESEEATEIEIVDDTPEKDRNRKPLDREIADPTDDELNEYSAKVQKRMKELTHKSHDERRKAEAAGRERAEFERASHSLAAENKRLNEYVRMGQTAYIDKSKSLAQNNMDTARAKMKAAFDAGDSESLAEAQQEMMAAQLSLEQVNNFKPAQLHEPEDSGYTPVNTQAKQPAIDNRVVDWASRNDWFERSGDEDMTGFAYGVHNKLVRQYGPEYTRTDEYYSKLDSAMRKVFPDRLEGSDDDTEDDTPPAKQLRPKNVVAPATRSTTPKKIRLTLTEQNVAKKLGIPLELYAKNKAALENDNGR